MRDWSGDVWSSVSQIDGEDLGSRWCGQQARTKWQDASAVAGGAFREYNEDSVRVLLQVGVEVDESCTFWRSGLRMEECSKCCM